MEWGADTLLLCKWACKQGKSHWGLYQCGHNTVIPFSLNRDRQPRVPKTWKECQHSQHSFKKYYKI